MSAIEYGHTQSGQILLERKDDLRQRLGYSPDELDSLCCTFAAPISVEMDDDRVEEIRRRRRQYEEDPASMFDAVNDYNPVFGVVR